LKVANNALGGAIGRKGKLVVHGRYPQRKLQFN
jgi:hypothetical protein